MATAGAHDTGEQRRRADGKVGQATVGRDEEHPHQRQQDGKNLKHPRPAPLLGADHQQNNDRGEVLQDRPHARTGQLDRQKIGELAAADTGQTVNQQVNGIARIFPYIPRIKKHFTIPDAEIPA